MAWRQRTCVAQAVNSTMDNATSAPAHQFDGDLSTMRTRPSAT